MYFSIDSIGNVNLMSDVDELVASTQDNGPPQDPHAFIASVQENASSARVVPPWPKTPPAWYFFISLVWPNGYGWNFTDLDATTGQDIDILASVAPYKTRQQANTAMADFKANAASYEVK